MSGEQKIRAIALAEAVKYASIKNGFTSKDVLSLARQFEMFIYYGKES